MDSFHNNSYGIVRPFLSLTEKYEYSSIIQSKSNTCCSEEEAVRMALFALRGIESPLFTIDTECDFRGISLAGLSDESTAQILLHFRSTFLLRKSVSALCESFREDSLDYAFKTLANTLEQLLILYDNSCGFLQQKVTSQLDCHSLVTVLHESSLFRVFLLEIMCCVLPLQELSQLRYLLSGRIASTGCKADCCIPKDLSSLSGRDNNELPGGSLNIGSAEDISDDDIDTDTIIGNSSSVSSSDHSFVSSTTDCPDDSDSVTGLPHTGFSSVCDELFSKLLSPTWLLSVFSGLSSWELFDRLYRQMIYCPPAVRDPSRRISDHDSAPSMKVIVTGVLLKTLSKPLLTSVVDILFEENAYRSLARRLKTETILGHLGAGSSQAPDISISYSPSPAKARRGKLGNRSVRAHIDAAPLLLSPINSLAPNSSSSGVQALYQQYCPLLLISMLSLQRVFDCEPGTQEQLHTGGGTINSQFAAQVTSCLLWANARIIVCNATRNKHTLGTASASASGAGIDENEFHEVMDLAEFDSLLRGAFPFTYQELSEWIRLYRHIEMYSVRAEDKLVFLLNKWKGTRTVINFEGPSDNDITDVHTPAIMNEDEAALEERGLEDDRPFVLRTITAEAHDRDNDAGEGTVADTVMEPLSVQPELETELEMSSASVFVSELLTPPKALEHAVSPQFIEHKMSENSVDVAMDIIHGGNDKDEGKDEDNIPVKISNGTGAGETICAVAAAGAANRMLSVGSMRSILRQGSDMNPSTAAGDIVSHGGIGLMDRDTGRTRGKGSVRMAEAVEYSDGTASKPTAGGSMQNDPAADDAGTDSIITSPLGVPIQVPKRLFDEVKSALLRKYEEKGRVAERQLRASKWRQRALLSKQQRVLHMLRLYAADIKGWKRELRNGKRTASKQAAVSVPTQPQVSIGSDPVLSAEPTAHELIVGGAIRAAAAGLPRPIAVAETSTDEADMYTTIAGDIGLHSANSPTMDPGVEKTSYTTVAGDIGLHATPSHADHSSDSVNVRDAGVSSSGGGGGERDDEFVNRMVATNSVEAGIKPPVKERIALRSADTYGVDVNYGGGGDGNRKISRNGFLDPEMEAIAELLTRPLSVESMEEEERVNNLLSSLNDNMLLLGAECGVIEDDEDDEDEDGWKDSSCWGAACSGGAGNNSRSSYSKLMALSALRVKNCVVDVVTAQCRYVDRLATVNLLDNTAFLRIVDVLQETILLSPNSDFLQVFAQLMVSNTHNARKQSQSVRRMTQTHISVGPALRFETGVGECGGSSLSLATEYEDQISQLLWHNIRISDVFKNTVQLAHMRCSNICSDVDESGVVNLSSSYLVSLYIPWRDTDSNETKTMEEASHKQLYATGHGNAPAPASRWCYDIHGPLPTLFDSLNSIQVILPPLPFPLNTIYSEEVLSKFTRVSIRLLKIYQLLAVSKLLWEDCREVRMSMARRQGGGRENSTRARRKRAEAAAETTATARAVGDDVDVDANRVVSPEQLQQSLIDLLYSGLRGSIATLQCLLDFTADRIKSTQYRFQENVMLAADHGIAGCTMAVQQYASDLLLSCFVAEEDQQSAPSEDRYGTFRGLREVELSMTVLMEQLIESHQRLLEDIYLFFFYFCFPTSAGASTGDITSKSEECSTCTVATEEVQINVTNALIDGINRCSGIEKKLSDTASYGMLIQHSDSMFALVTILSAKI